MAQEQQQQQVDWSLPALDDIQDEEMEPGWGDLRAELIRYLRSPDTPTATYMANLIDDTARAIDPRDEVVEDQTNDLSDHVWQLVSIITPFLRLVQYPPARPMGRMAGQPALTRLSISSLWSLTRP